MPTTALTRAGRGPREGGRSGDDRVARVDSVQRLLLDGSNTHRIRIRRRRATFHGRIFRSDPLLAAGVDRTFVRRRRQARLCTAIARGLCGRGGTMRAFCALLLLWRAACRAMAVAATANFHERRQARQERRLRDDDNRGRGRLSADRAALHAGAIATHAPAADDHHCFLGALCEVRGDLQAGRAALWRRRRGRAMEAIPPQLPRPRRRPRF